MAHTIGRKYDEKRDDGTQYVNPDGIIPLCAIRENGGKGCHPRYDQNEVGILHVLTLDEQAYAVRHVGIVRALSIMDVNSIHAI